MTHIFQAVLLAERRKHGAVDLKLAELRVAVEELNEVDLGKRLESVGITAELNLHHQMLGLGAALQHMADGSPAPLDATQRQLLQHREPVYPDSIHPP